MSQIFHVIAYSANSQSELDAQLASVQRQLEVDPSTNISELTTPTLPGNLDGPFRAAACFQSTDQLLNQLRDGKIIIRHVDEAAPRPNLCLMLTGQGAQYRNMGRGLYKHFTIFRDAVDQCATILADHLDRPLLDLLYPPQETPQDDEPLNQTGYTQPALFTLEYALGKLWASLGIKPDILIGHSVGEYAACTLAGAISLEEGLRLISARARLMQALPAGGTMAAIRASPDEVAARLAAHHHLGCLEISALNGPKQVVVSGTIQAIDSLIESLKADKIKASKLAVSHAFHSALMDPMLDEFTHIASQLQFQKPHTTLISNLTGKPVTALDSGYWWAHVRHAVNFTGGMEAIDQIGRTTFLEIGPHPVLLAMGSRCINSDRTQMHNWVPSLKRGQNEIEMITQAACELYTLGHPVDLSKFGTH